MAARRVIETVVVTALLAATQYGCSSDGNGAPLGSPAATGAPTTTGPLVTVPGATGPLVTVPGATGTAPTSTDHEPKGSTDTVYERGDIDEGLRPFIDQATSDLATRLSIDPTAVTVLSAVLVTWPDSSLGCPQPGMQYAQVATDGSIIELGVGAEGNEVVHRYHTGGSRGPFLCDQPLERKPAAGG